MNYCELLTRRLRLLLQSLALVPLLFAPVCFAAPANWDAFADLAPAWRTLARKLVADGLPGSEVNDLLATLPATPTQAPMGRKIRELYQKKFFPSKKKTTPLTYYKGVVTQANADLCRAYIKEHESAFSQAYERFGLPPAVGAALLFVETRLGKVLGDIPENAFYTLASMAVSNTPSEIGEWLPKLKNYASHMEWLDRTMRQRAAWAYNETLALVRHMLRDGVRAEQLPGSIYGAVGVCQFMPSNIEPYGADGDGDGRINLFSDADAIASMANYLARHGWKKGLDNAQQHRLLMTYNHSVVYANTILALAALVSGKNPPAPVAKPAPKKTGKRSGRR